MDFTEFEVELEAPVFVQFNHPFLNKLLFEQKTNDDGTKVDDLEKPVGVKLYGQDSQKFIQRAREIQDKKILAAQKARNAQAININQAEIEKNNRDTVKACIHSFVNVSWQGEDLGERRDQYDAFFIAHPWAFNFCNAAIMDRSNFQKASQKNS